MSFSARWHAAASAERPCNRPEEVEPEEVRRGRGHRALEGRRAGQARPEGHLTVDDDVKSAHGIPGLSQ